METIKINDALVSPVMMLEMGLDCISFKNDGNFYKASGVVFDKSVSRWEDKELRYEIYIKERHFDHVFAEGEMRVSLKNNDTTFWLIGKKKKKLYLFTFPSAYYMPSDDGEGYTMIIGSDRKMIEKKRDDLITGKLTREYFKNLPIEN